jgi:uroporphyrin-III C-methyltransferase
MSLDDFPEGSVWLIGAGPGDAELLTRKAERLLRRAEVVFYDALVGPGVLALAASDAELISVGKRSGRHSRDQGTIDRLLVQAALAGKRVARLKGGDPSIFGRSSEEISALAAHGITVRVCPGITAASAAAASAKISLTLRGSVRSLTYVTAHARAGEPLMLDWSRLAAADNGLAIYMGRAAAPEIAHNLVSAGLDPATPIIVASNVSLGSERLIHGILSSLPFLVASIAGDDPTLLLIGQMAAGRVFHANAGRVPAGAIG